MCILIIRRISKLSPSLIGCIRDKNSILIFKFFIIMAEITLGGSPANTLGDIPTTGQKAPDFRFVKQDLSETALADIDSKAVVILAVPSLDTSVCATETRKFNEKLSNMADVTCIVISKDLPFAMKRFCETEGIANVVPASDFRYNEFGKNYSVDIADGPFKGLSARAVFVVDQNKDVKYSELVKEVGEEPNYEQTLSVVEKLIA